MRVEHKKSHELHRLGRGRRRLLLRRLKNRLTYLIDHYPAVGLLGPRQVGKTTLALEVATDRPSVYLDLESTSDRARLSDPEQYCADHADELIILDEVHRAPDVFLTLRGLIDRGRRGGRKTGRFLLLGSAGIDLLKQSGETLAGRISYLSSRRSTEWKCRRTLSTGYG